MAEPYHFELTGGWLALDFNNTLDQDHDNNDIERLNHYSDLVRWSMQAGIIHEDKARELIATGERKPDAAQVVLAQAVELRRLIYRIFSAVSAERTPNPADMTALNAALTEALVWLRVDVQGGWTWADAGNRLDQMLWRVVWSAAQLLVSDKVERVHECDNTACTWIFLDETRNHSRRWCSMEGCGNRMKARRHYRRVKGKPEDV